MGSPTRFPQVIVCRTTHFQSLVIDNVRFQQVYVRPIELRELGCRLLVAYESEDDVPGRAAQLAYELELDPPEVEARI